MAAVLVIAHLSTINMEGNQENDFQESICPMPVISVALHGPKNLSIAKSKAELESKKSLAQQVQTNLKVVADNYAQELVGNQASELLSAGDPGPRGHQHHHRGHSHIG